LDGIAKDLQQVRQDAGCPSFSDIELKVAKAREARGIAPAAARIPRTTIYDCFRTGRRRVNPELVGEIVQALTGDARQAAQWVKRCQAATASTQQPHNRVSEADGNASGWQLASPKARSLQFNLAVVVACAAGNIVVASLAAVLFYHHLPLYLDMIGTAIASMALGPWWGAMTGVLVNLGMVGVNGVESIPFALVQIVGALAWGYGVRRWRMARSLPRYVGLNVLVAACCSLAAVPVLLVFFGGNMMNPTLQTVAQQMTSVGDQLVTSIVSLNFVMSLVDKLLAGFAALVVAGTLLKRYAPTDLVALTMTPTHLTERPSTERMSSQSTRTTSGSAKPAGCSL